MPPRPYFPLCLLLFMAFASYHAQGQTRHRLAPMVTLGTVGSGIALYGLGEWQGKRVLTMPLPGLASIPGMDRRAIGLWHPPADRSSDLLFGVAAVAAFGTAILNQHGQQPLLPATIMAESGLLSLGLTHTVKELARRPRPYLYNPAVPATAYQGADDHRSFWSGHTAHLAAITFSCAALVQRSDASPWLRRATWAAAVLAPAAMGYLRVRSGQHYPSDVLAGYAAGAAIGLGVSYLHRSR